MGICTIIWKERGILVKNGSQAQHATAAHFFHRNASQAVSGKQHRVPSGNSSWTLPGQKPGLLQRNTSQAQRKKRPDFSDRNPSQELPGEKHGLPHRNTSSGVARKDPSSSHKNSSRALIEEKPEIAFRNVSHFLTEEKLRAPHRNASWVVPRKRPGGWHRNASTAESNKEPRPPHRNSSWALPGKQPRNVSQALTGTKRGTVRKSGRQSKVGNALISTPFKNSTQREAVKEQTASRKNVSRAGAGTPKWRPLVPKERDEPLMPSLPPTCLLSEHAIACGNARLMNVPKLSDPALKTLYLAENEITQVPAGIFLDLPNLEWLDLSKNKLDSSGLHPEAFKNLTKLKRLNLDGNQLTAIPALPSSLQELKLNDNRLEGLQRNNFRGGVPALPPPPPPPLPLPPPPPPLLFLSISANSELGIFPLKGQDSAFLLFLLLFLLHLDQWR
ncbi:uncharacterized protein LOC125428008 [Sphaerodactylus townsendi]|uniref:uncharacterized protein LOC125428008 n=1 Tax=Sphaerodactylus townsendi TaxID=933632 RepID=UPI0020270EE9|nr:uncharacterized protein LOC125428008 [Sphaerodactylus townsendi]